MRADCAPRATFGDGAINSGDVVQGRRYSTGLDPLTVGAGPAGGLEGKGSLSFLDDVYAYFFGREIKVASQKAQSGTQVTIPIEITPYGDEVAASFTLEYNGKVFSNPRVALGDAAAVNSVLTVNVNDEGRIGILVDSGDPMTVSAMPRQFVLVTFDVAQGAEGNALITFTGSLAAQATSDADGKLLSTRYTDGVVSIY